ncbi:MAG: hypothetical protein K8H74_18410 [Notoacmeibacter sp.]|nr:hypothetical protein [Notoacmeibacter sp.]
MADDTDILVFKVDGVEHEIVLDGSSCPRTLAQVKANLPATVDIHCAKIAGSHIMWPVPFVERVEKAADVLDMPAGSFFLWPERQYLEITYDALQAETASVNYLGQVRGDVTWLSDYAERQRREQGRELFTAEVCLKGVDRQAVPGQDLPPQDGSPWTSLKQARREAWSAEPADIARLLARRGLNIPFGPLAMAEGELRKLHELLWRLWNAGPEIADSEKISIARFTAEAAITRVGGFCHMTDTALVLQKLIACLSEHPADLDEILVEGTLYTGRMAAWLDLHIQWWPINELTLKTLENTNSSRKEGQ